MKNTNTFHEVVGKTCVGLLMGAVISALLCFLLKGAGARMATTTQGVIALACIIFCLLVVFGETDSKSVRANVAAQKAPNSATANAISRKLIEANRQQKARQAAVADCLADGLYFWEWENPENADTIHLREGEPNSEVMTGKLHMDDTETTLLGICVMDSYHGKRYIQAPPKDCSQEQPRHSKHAATTQPASEPIKTTATATEAPKEQVPDEKEVALMETIDAVIEKELLGPLDIPNVPDAILERNAMQIIEFMAQTLEKYATEALAKGENGFEFPWPEGMQTEYELNMFAKQLMESSPMAKEVTVDTENLVVKVSFDEDDPIGTNSIDGWEVDPGKEDVEEAENNDDDTSTGISAEPAPDPVVDIDDGYGPPPDIILLDESGNPIEDVEYLP